jgi:hypothetical protein
MAEKTNKWVVVSITKNTFKKDLSLTESILLKIIEKLDKGHGCYASNAYFAEYLNISAVTVSRNISSLHKAGYISISYDRKNLAVLRRTIKLIKKTEYSLDSQINGVINYVDQMFKRESDFIPLENKENARENIAKKLKEFGSQQELINYLQKNKSEFASTDGVNLWLKGELDITAKEHQATNLQETSQDKPQESNPLLADDSVQPKTDAPIKADTTPKLTQEERMKIFRGKDVEPKQNEEASNTSEDPINQETSQSDNYLFNNADSYFNDLLKEDQKSYDDNI